MASEAQIAANRANAQKSTGPKTEAGKAASSANAMKHGMTSSSYLVFDEAEEDFAAFRDCVRRDYEPEGAAEEEIVERIVMAGWFLRRAWRTEAAMIDEAAYDVAKSRAREVISRELWPEPPKRMTWDQESEHNDRIQARFRKLSRAEVMAYAADPSLGPRPPAFPAGVTQLIRYQAHHERALQRAIAQLTKLRSERRREQAAHAAARRARFRAMEQERAEALGRVLSPDAAKRTQFYDAAPSLNGSERPPMSFPSPVDGEG